MFDHIEIPFHILQRIIPSFLSLSAPECVFTIYVSYWDLEQSWSQTPLRQYNNILEWISPARQLTAEVGVRETSVATPS